MDETPNLALPYIVAAQAQKHVTHNEAIRALDAVVQIGALDRDLAAPPGSPANGDRYIVAPSASGAWLGKVGQYRGVPGRSLVLLCSTRGLDLLGGRRGSTLRLGMAQTGSSRSGLAGRPLGRVASSNIIMAAALGGQLGVRWNNASNKLEVVTLSNWRQPPPLTSA